MSPHHSADRARPLGFTTERLEHLRAGLSPQPRPPVRQVTRREVLSEIRMRLGRAGAVMIAANRELTTAVNRWLDEPVSLPDQR